MNIYNGSVVGQSVKEVYCDFLGGRCYFGEGQRHSLRDASLVLLYRRLPHVFSQRGLVVPRYILVGCARQLVIPTCSLPEFVDIADKH